MDTTSPSLFLELLCSTLSNSDKFQMILGDIPFSTELKTDDGQWAPASPAQSWNRKEGSRNTFRAFLNNKRINCQTLKASWEFLSLKRHHGEGGVTCTF